MQGKVRRAVGLAAVGVLAGGCARSVDVPDLERRLSGDLRDEFDTAYAVDCPDAVALAARIGFACSARGEDGTVLTLQITTTGHDASVTYEIVEG